MPDIGGGLNAISLFAGVIGLLFGNWMQDIDSALDQTLPSHYGNRKLYFRKIVEVFFFKSLPLTAILLAFMYALAPLALAIIGQREMFNLLTDSAAQIDMEATIFLIVTSAMAYFLIVSSFSSYQLMKSWWIARRGRKDKEPKIHLLG